MRVLGVDPGYGRLGLAVVEKDKAGEKLIFSDCISTPSTLPFPERLSIMASAFEKAIRDWQPETVAIEELFFTTNQKTAIKVAEIRGVLIYISSKQNLPVFEYNPLTIKNSVTGWGQADKKQIQSLVEKLIKIDKKIKYDDEYDAIAVALTHLAHSKY